MLINSSGKIVSTYSKLHLFDVDCKEVNLSLKESSYCKPGDKIVPPVETPVGNVALSIVSFILYLEFTAVII